MTLWNTKQAALDEIAPSTQSADEPEASEPAAELAEPESADEDTGQAPAHAPAAKAPVGPAAVATVPKPKQAVPVVAASAAPPRSVRGCSDAGIPTGGHPGYVPGVVRAAEPERATCK